MNGALRRFALLGVVGASGLAACAGTSGPSRDERAGDPVSAAADPRYVALAVEGFG